MRQIKFRGKRIDNSEWVYGDIHLNKDCTKGHIHKRGERVKSFDIDPATVGQFINRHDKNGVEIYEGDIINFKNKPPFVDLSCEVVFDEDVAAFAVHNYDISRHTMFYELPDVDYEVIDNIHDHLELIEKGT